MNYMIKDAHYLPIPYPRFLNRKLVTADGFIVKVPESPPVEFKKPGIAELTSEEKQAQLKDNFHQ